MSHTKIGEIKELSQRVPVLNPPEVEKVIDYVLKQKDQLTHLALVAPKHQLPVFKSIDTAEKILQRNWEKTHPLFGIPIIREE